MVWETEGPPRPVDCAEDSTVCIPNERVNVIINHYTDGTISAFIERGVAFMNF
jgi:hypothetical protein